MARPTTQGKCRLCGAIYSKGGMSKHLEKCKQTHPPQPTGQGKLQTTRIFHIVAQGHYDPDYWLHVEIPANARLTDLDNFLRATWLECCGHLSAFNIQGQSYASRVFNDGWSNDRSMNIALDRVFRPGLKFNHEYDFGTTTELDLRVVSERTGQFRGKSPQILARNDPPEIICQACGKNQATEVCTMCIYEGEGWLCEACAEEHECGEDYFLPVVNSPRVGMCGYTG